MTVTLTVPDLRPAFDAIVLAIEEVEGNKWAEPGGKAGWKRMDPTYVQGLREEKALLDDGVFSQEEFDRAKANLDQESQEQGERQVDRTRLGVVKHTDAQHEGQRRGDPQLEQRPEQGQAGDHLGHRADGRARADILGDQFLGGKLLVMHGANLHC
jgi:hypothetical protein